ncbi:MAG: DUF3892 domain-containing protein [Actinomycetota bacterium]
MDKPDTIIELHRAVIEEIGKEEFRPEPNPPAPFQTQEVQGTATVDVSVSRIWFATDENGRVWDTDAGTPEEERERHFAFDLRLRDHPPELGLADSKIVVTKVLGLPAPTIPPTSCQGKNIPANEIPLLGRLTVHEQLERIDLTLDGEPHQNIVLDHVAQPAPVLRSTRPRAGVDARLFGPDVQRAGDGSVTLTGNDPRVTWELTRAEQLCIVESTVGKLLVAKGMAGGLSRAEAEVAMLEMVAGKLAEGVADKLLMSGDDGTSIRSILPAPVQIDPAGEKGDAIEVDARVKRWNRPESGDPAESLVFQLKTLEGLPDADRLPESVLALREQEEVGFSRAGWALLRSLRRSQIKSLCLKKDASDFDPDEPCELKRTVGIEVSEEDADLEKFRAWIEPSAEVGEELLHVEGRAEGGNWAYGWYIEFELVYRLGRGEVPRDPVGSERPRPGGTLEEINARLEVLQEQKCAGSVDHDAVKEEIKELNAQKKLPPQTIGVKPILHGEPVTSSDGWITTAGWIAGIALGALLAVTGLGVVAAISTKVAFTAVGAIVAAFIAGVAVGGTLLFFHAEYLDVKVDAGLQKFVNDKRDPSGDKIPLDGYQPIHVELTGALKVYLEEIPQSLRVEWREPDTPYPVGDEDYITQMVAGKLPGEERIWVLTVDDAVRYMTKGRLSLSVQNGAGPIPVHVSTSSRGRKYLRTDPDAGPQNNLEQLPPVPL